ncbi:CYTH domain-containing protein [Candidatus Parcubacteria bacterium]|nr:MAG: CYTH domain-containing protein [Candidatus Parcubacteria bacterium]
MQTYEIEVKSLLGNESRAEEIRQAMRSVDRSCTLKSKNKQLNHYFEGGDLAKLAEVVDLYLGETAREKFNDIVKRGKGFSVRTRDKDGEVFIVVKASVDDTTSENGIARIEFEEKVRATLEELDKLVLLAGFKYQAKWSREREEYECLGTNVTLDKNAGYGWLAEFERIVTDPKEVDAASKEIRSLMARLGVTELPQDRLERMFAYYNEHWMEYYGTDKVFVVE